jgi:uncharacterized protein YkwD
MVGRPRLRAPKALTHLMLLLLPGCVPVGEGPPRGPEAAPPGRAAEGERGPSGSDAAGGSTPTASAPSALSEPAPAPAAPVRGTPPPPPPEGVCTPSPGQALVEAVNQVRRRAGLPLLLVDRRLVEAARSHTVDMARRDGLGHDGSDGRQVQHRAEARGYDWLLIAENVASGQPTVADVMGSWMDSPGHRRNILNPAARHIGAASARSSGGRMYWTQVFGNTEIPAPQPGGCHP